MTTPRSKDRFGRLESRLGRIEAKADTRFGEVEARFAQIDARFAQVDARFAQVDARFEELRTEMNARFADVEVRLASHSSEIRRHFDVVAEGLRGDFRLLTEFVQAHITRMDARVSGHDEEFLRLEREFFTALKLSHDGLDRRLTSVEGRVDRLEKPPPS